MTYLSIFGLEFENNIVIFDIRHTQIDLIAKFLQNMQKCLNQGPKTGYFQAKILNQHPPICDIAKFCEKLKIPKFRTKNALLEYFQARILKNYYHI